jgi:hypothetical protein
MEENSPLVDRRQVVNCFTSGVTSTHYRVRCGTLTDRWDDRLPRMGDLDLPIASGRDQSCDVG